MNYGIWFKKQLYSMLQHVGNICWHNTATFIFQTEFKTSSWVQNVKQHRLCVVFLHMWVWICNLGLLQQILKCYLWHTIPEHDQSRWWHLSILLLSGIDRCQANQKSQTGFLDKIAAQNQDYSFSQPWYSQVVYVPPHALLPYMLAKSNIISHLYKVKHHLFWWI